MTTPVGQIADVDISSSDDQNDLSNHLPKARELPSKYVFRNPFASRIHRITNLDETLSLLHQINESQRSDKRLPTEILLRINDEVPQNVTFEKIRTTWSAFPGIYPRRGPFHLGFFEYRDSPLRVQLDLSARKYLPLQHMESLHPDLPFMPRFFPYHPGTSIEELYCQVSSADILYRLRCYFPEITIDSDLDRYKCVWKVYIRHNQTGMLLLFLDNKAAAEVHIHYDEESKYQGGLDDDTKKEVEEAFLADGIEFLNSLFGTRDGSRRMLFYHPFADADFPTDDERYTAVPIDYTLPRCNERISSDMEDPEAEAPGFRFDVYEPWRTTNVSDSDLSSFRSILQELKYDIPSRKVKRLNGTSDLTTVISSPLLFYRLICKFMLGRTHTNINQTPPITSVWQIQLVHRTAGASIIFMDNYGVFDIRADEKAKEVMSDIVGLVEGLCSDSCTHPYDYVLAGCVA